MAQYQVGSSLYEIPDNISQQQLNEVLTELASREQPQQQQGTDGALAYSVDKAQQMLGKGVEVAGDLVGSDTVKQFGSDVVAQQDKDIAAGGYKPTYTGSLRETYNKGGISNALGWIAEKSMENAASGGTAIAGTGLAALTAPFSASAALLIGGGTLATSGLMGAGESAMEQEDKTGDYDSKVAAGTGVIVGILDKFGAGKVIPTSDLAKLSGQELVERLIKAGHPNAAKNIGKRILKSFGSEAATETAQEAAIVGSAVTQGGEYTKDELIDRGIDAAVLGGTMGGTTTTAIETAKATGRGVQNVTGMAQEEVTPEVQAARGDFATRLDRIATGNGMNLKNVGKMGSKGAVDAVDNAHTEIASEIDLATDGLNQTNETTLNKRKGDTALVAEKKAKARLAIKNAKNKVKGIVTNDQLAVVEELVGGTTEGQQLLNLMRESNELTALHKAGYVGGLSQYTDLMSPLGGRAGYDTGMIATERMLRPLITGGAAFQTGGASLALQGGIAATGRIVDAVTGRRSRVAKFIKNNRGKSGQQVSAGSSARAKGLAAFRARQAEIERKKREAAEKRRQQQAENARRRAEEAAKADRDREMNIQMYKDGTRQSVGYNPDSPQDVLLKGTGMDLRNIEIALAEIVRNYPSSHAYSISASSALKSLRQGGRIEGLSNLIRVINSMVMNGTTQAKQVRQPDDGAINRYRENEAIKRGIEANRAFAQSLIDALDADTSVDSFSKGIIKSKLETYKNDDLGLDPLGRARQELQDAIEVLQANNGNVEKANQYLGQYIARIETQQNARRNQGQEQPQPQPQPQPQSNKTDPINHNITRDNLVVGSRLELQKALTKQFKEAQKDNRYVNKDFRTFNGSDTDFGKANFSKDFDDHTVSVIASIKPFLDNISDRFEGVPRIRGFKTTNNSKAAASMGDGVMSLNPSTMNSRLAYLQNPELSKEEKETRINELYLELKDVGNKIESIEKDLDAFLRKYDLINPDNSIKIDKLRSIKSDPQASKELARLEDRKDYAFLEKREIHTLIDKLNAGVKSFSASTWKIGDPVDQRPYNAVEYFDNGIDRVLKTLVHELGHHIHQTMLQDPNYSNNIQSSARHRPIEIWMKSRADSLIKGQNGDLQPSGYSVYNTKEWFAENFSLYFMGRKDLVGTEFTTLIESLLLNGRLPND